MKRIVMIFVLFFIVFIGILVSHNKIEGGFFESNEEMNSIDNYELISYKMNLLSNKYREKSHLYDGKVEEEIEQQKIAKKKNDNENKIREIKEIKDNINRPIFKIDIPLSNEILDYTYELSKENDLPYTLILAVMEVESDFNPNEVSETKDFGLMQINKNNFKWIGNELGLKNINIFNEKQNIQMGIWYLSYVRDHWKKNGVNEDKLFTATVLSYNRGIGGATSWIKRHGYKNVYVEHVLNYKSKLEQNLIK